MEKIKAKVNDLIHPSDHSSSTTGTTHTGTTGNVASHAHGDHSGPHQSKLANQVDPRIDSSHTGPTGNAPSAGGYGGSHTGAPQHDSNIANKMDPRVPTSSNTGMTGSNTHSGSGLTGSNTHSGSGLTGSHNTHSTGTGLGGSHGSDPRGPHDSHLANVADPRVDSDRIGGGRTGHNTGLGSNTHSATHGGGMTGSHGTHGSDPRGPHDSHLANVADPRVDSDRIGGDRTGHSAGGYGNTHSSGLTGSHNTHSTGTGLGGSHGAPVHDSAMANKMDPRVDSDRTGGYGNTHSSGLTGGTHNTGYGATGTHGTGAHGTGHHLPGPADNTAGPHSSNMANKLDPRVDSDLDGSKKVGGDRTFG